MLRFALIYLFPENYGSFRAEERLRNTVLKFYSTHARARTFLCLSNFTNLESGRRGLFFVLCSCGYPRKCGAHPVFRWRATFLVGACVPDR